MRGTASADAAPRRCAGEPRGIEEADGAPLIVYPPPPLLTHCDALTGMGRGGGGAEALRAMPRADPVICGRAVGWAGRGCSATMTRRATTGVGRTCCTSAV